MLPKPQKTDVTSTAKTVGSEASTSRNARINKDSAGPSRLLAGKQDTMSNGHNPSGLVVSDVPESIKEERRRLSVQKQTELDQIFNKHDDLVSCSQTFL